jgi:eukaryotic-like serine/threonine-protein kinase
VTHRWPHVLPGARAVVFTAHHDVLGFGEARLVVQELPHGARKVLYAGGSYAHYLPSGHLLFARANERAVFAAPFDLKRLSVIGEAVPVLDDVRINPLTGASEFTASHSGTIAYGGFDRAEVPVFWMARDGKLTPLREQAAPWSHASFSPDGTRIALQILAGQRMAVWVYDWHRDTLSRVSRNAYTSEGGPGMDAGRAVDRVLGHRTAWRPIRSVLAGC